MPSLTSAEFRELFNSARRSAFRLETLQRYSVANEAEEFQAFLAGRPLPPERAARKGPWLARLRETTGQGMLWQRVHIVRRPLSNYLRFQLIGYQENVPAGEDIRLADGEADSRLAELMESRTDFWLFDEKVVVMMRYDPDGQLVDRERADHLLDQCSRQRDLTLALATPLEDYLVRRLA